MEEVFNRQELALAYALSMLKESSLAERIANVILYGSSARGDYTPSSDVDIMVLFDEPDFSDSVFKDEILRIKSLGREQTESVAEIDFHFAAKSNFLKDDSMFVRAIKREGVEIWNTPI